MLIIDVAYNLTFLIAFAVISGLLDNRYSSLTLKGTIAQGFLFGFAAAISMLNPFELYTGLIFDGRSVAISLVTLFFGPIAGVIATLITVSLRIYLGGQGLIIGVLLSIVALIGGYLFRLMWNRASAPSMGFLFSLGLAVHVVMVYLLFLLPVDLQLDAFIRSTPTILIFYPIASVLMGKILSGQLEIRHLLHKVRESEEKFRAIFNSTNEAIFLHDAETG